MTDETTDSGLEATEEQEVDIFESPEIDVQAAADDLAADLFGKKPDNAETEEVDLDQETEATEPEPEKVEPEPEPEPEVEKNERPASWKKDMQEVWDSMDKKAQDYVIQREEQMKAGLAIDREDSNLGRTMRDIISPYSNILRQNGVEETTMVRNLLNGHMQLVSANPEQRKAMFQQMAQSYGVQLTEGDTPAVDPRIASLEGQVRQLTGILSQQQRKELENTRNQIYTKVNEFADSHPDFEELAEPISKYIAAGFELEDAYQAAVRNSPVHFERELARIRQEEADKLKAVAKKSAEKVKQTQSVKVRNLDRGKAPTAPTGSMDDTLHDVYREILNRN